MPQEFASSTMTEPPPSSISSSIPTTIQPSSASHSPPRKPSNQSNRNSRPASNTSDLHSRIIAQKREKAREHEGDGRRGGGGRSNHHHHHHQSRQSSSNRWNQDDLASNSDASSVQRRNHHPTSSASSSRPNPIQEAPKAPKAALRAIQRGPGMDSRRVMDLEAASVGSGGGQFESIGGKGHDQRGGGKDRSGNGGGHRHFNPEETEVQASSGARELFDPRRHDPIGFKKRGGGGSNFPSGSTTSEARSYGASTSNTFTSNSVASASAPSVTSSDASRERRQRRRPGQSDNGSEGKASASKDGEARNAEGSGRTRGEGGETNSYVLEIKKTYREISTLESKLQEENRTFAERGRGRGPVGKTLLAKDSTSSNSASELDHEFWLELAGKHKKLAETHATFMELALRPGLPASLHSLPQTYNIPTRLWQTAFHTMLERLRHSLPLSQHSNSSIPTPSLISQQGALLEHLTEFIYYAYSFYSNLHESETFKVFRSSWIESLGDLARYRMAVAGLSAGLITLTERMKGGNSSSNRREQLARIDDEGGNGADQEPRVRGADEASIGLAALDDWDLEEKETWRVTARDWYARGLAEMPGTGRLHHHLGILTRNVDELRALHHFCKR